MEQRRIDKTKQIKSLQTCVIMTTHKGHNGYFQIH